MTRTVLGSLLLVCMLLVAHTGRAQDQNTIDDQALNAFFASNKIKATKTPSGLYYVVKRPGQGENAKFGKHVSMLYYGTLLDGKKFDANMDEAYKPTGNPFTFTLGVGQVIKGWDEGVKLLNKGERATLYIPSSLGYGSRGVGPIPPNSVLVFDVEVVSTGE